MPDSPLKTAIRDEAVAEVKRDGPTLSRILAYAIVGFLAALFSAAGMWLGMRDVAAVPDAPALPVGASVGDTDAPG